MILSSPFPSIFILMFCLALIISSVGFKKVVWFISIGYGYSVSALSILIAANSATGGITLADHPLFYLHSLILFLYGLRLGTFLIIRETQNSFKSEAKATDEMNGNVPVPAKIGIWVTVSALYVSMTSPLTYHASALAASAFTNPVLPLTLAGLLISLAGIFIESIADWQKSAYKKVQPDRFADKGLYRIVRFPNYFGEMLIWFGSWLASIPFLSHWSHWIISLIGLIVIELIMVGSAKRLELKQESRYGKDSEFISYSRNVPILFPLVPLYSLKKVWLAIGW